MERRKFLIGAGSLAAGSAAAMGTGAFTSVEADRTVSITTTGDQSAFLKFSKATNDNEQDDDNDGNVTENAEEYVALQEGNKLSLDFTGATLNENGGGSGINKSATTVFDDLFDITNQGTQKVKVGVKSKPSGIKMYAEGDDAASDSATQDDAASLDWDDADDAVQQIAPGETIKNVGVYVTDPSSVSGGTFTLRAEAVNNND